MKKWICALAAIAVCLCALAYAQGDSGESTTVSATVVSVSYEELSLSNVRTIQSNEEETSPEEREREQPAQYLHGETMYGGFPGYGNGYYGYTDPFEFFEDWFYNYYSDQEDTFSGQSLTLKVTEDTEAYRMKDGEKIAITLNEVQPGDEVTVVYRDDTALSVVVEEPDAYSYFSGADRPMDGQGEGTNT